MATMKSTLGDVQVIRDMLMRGIQIQMPDGTITTKDDYACFGIIRKTDAPFLDLEGIARDIANKDPKKTEEQREVKYQEKYDELIHKYSTLGNFMKLESGAAVGRQNGFYVIPFYPGMKKVTALRWWREKKDLAVVKTIKDDDSWVPKKAGVEYDRLALDVDLFDIPEKIEFPLEMEMYWGDNPRNLLNAAAMIEGVPYMYEATIKLKQPDDIAMQLNSIIKSKDLVMKLRINMGNSITNACYTIFQKEKFDALKDEFLKVCPNTTYIEEAYREFREILENRPISERTGKPIQVTSGNFKPTKLIPMYRVWEMLYSYHMQVLAEDHIAKSIKDLVYAHPFWKQYLEGIKGCGFTHAGYIIAGLDPTVCRHPSGWIRYLGLDVVWNEKYQKFSGRSKKFLREMPLVMKDGTVQICDTLGYNTELKSRIWLLANNLIKSKDPYYDKVYRDAYEYYTNRPDLKQVWALKDSKNKSKDKQQLKYTDTDGNEVSVDFEKAAYSGPHLMAIRKLMCTFVVDLWIAERRILGLPLNGGRYEEGKLGKVHGYEHTPVHTGYEHTPKVIDPKDVGENPYLEESYIEAMINYT